MTKRAKKNLPPTGYVRVTVDFWVECPRRPMGIDARDAHPALKEIVAGRKFERVIIRTNGGRGFNVAAIEERERAWRDLGVSLTFPEGGGQRAK